MDVFSPEKRSQVMSRIRSKDTKPEKIIRSILHKLGFRFRINRKDLPGKPDIVLPKYKTVIFVHGCFWHQHEGCRIASNPKSNIDFWNKKFSNNIERDKKNQKALKKMGYRVFVIWECEVKFFLKNSDELRKMLLSDINYIFSLKQNHNDL
ncbi:DNA mismatch endonuclease Vsr [uncultured Akkermansia sp.]|uniref:very short patch repair endonuclease n=1 Tax=uncultured Akkermansia sp. TaxID=512294 RepID=UPI00260B2C60|nr:DNA mismatch endonuclease Vsr [uncultured Akkermansia sp.]